MVKVCQQCKKEFSAKDKKRKFCSRQCSAKSISQKVECTCERCGAGFLVSPSALARGRSKFCGRKCFHEYHREYMTENPSVPRNKNECTCETCGIIFMIWPTRLTREGYNQGRFCSRKCKHAWQRTVTGADHPLDTKIECVCEWCKKQYRTKHVYKDRTRFCSRRCQGSYAAANMDRMETSIEASIRKLLDAMLITYDQEKKMGPWVCDFIVESAKLIIECDGVYWHSSAKVKKRDAQKDKWITTHGYKVLRLPEQLIKTDIQQCAEKIRLFMDSETNPYLPRQMKLF